LAKPFSAISYSRGTSINAPGVFLAGDCANWVYRLAITASGLSCAATMEPEPYLAARRG